MTETTATAPDDTARPPRNIVLCSDGTGNSGGKKRGTNVYRLYKAVRVDDNGIEQVKRYDDGVGTSSFKPLRIAGGAFGYGLSQNVRQLYRFAAEHYRAGDRIFIFGFSRGAFTARVLAGFICECGLPDVEGRSSKEVTALVNTAFKAFNRSAKRRDHAEANEFRRTRGTRGPFTEPGTERHIPVACVGVWDTVDAVGLPFDELTDALDFIMRFRFRRNDLHPLVQVGLHAIALDDERHTFHPVMWNEAPDADPEKDVPDDQWQTRIEQVWFPGMHSNVGGGYPRDQLAHVPLQWMIERLEHHGLGLRLDPSYREEFERDADPNGQMHDSRSGPAVYYRYRPRDVAALCDRYIGENHVRAKPRIHHSVLQRIAGERGRYAPTGLPREFEVVGGPAPPPRSGEHHALMRRARDLIVWRRASYFVFLAFTIALAIGGLILSPLEPPEEQHGVASLILGAAEFVTPAFADPMVQGYRSSPWALYLCLAGLAGSFLFSTAMRKRTARLASAAWRLPPGSGAAPEAQSIIGRIQETDLARRGQHLKRRFGSVLVLLLIIGIVGSIAIGRWRLSSTEGWSTVTPSIDPAVQLLGGAASVFDFDASTPLFAAPVILVEGERYELTVRPPDGTGPGFDWLDESIPASPDGLSIPGDQFGTRVFMTLASPLRKVVARPWFELQGRIGADGGHLPLGRSKTFTAPTTGRLHLFVNDAFYENNDPGAARVTVVHLARDTASPE